MFEMFKQRKPPTPPTPDRSTLVPRIKALPFKASFGALNLPEEQLPHTEPFVADLLIAYAFDLPGMLRMASRADITRLGLRPEEVRGAAIANLHTKLPEIGFTEQ